MYQGWIIKRYPHGVSMRDPRGLHIGVFEDFGAVLDALGPTTPARELAAEAAFHALERGGEGQQAAPTRPRAYICSPYAARDGETVDQHVLWARCLARLAWDDGYWPVAPHLYAPLWLSDADSFERAQGVAWGLDLLPGTRVLYGYSVERPSSGMVDEIAEAERLSLPVRVVSYAELADAAARLTGLGFPQEVPAYV